MVRNHSIGIQVPDASRRYVRFCDVAANHSFGSQLVVFLHTGSYSGSQSVESSRGNNVMPPGTQVAVDRPEVAPVVDEFGETDFGFRSEGEPSAKDGVDPFEEGGWLNLIAWNVCQLR